MPSTQAALLYPTMALCAVILCLATLCLATLILFLPPPWCWFSWGVAKSKRLFRRRKAQALSGLALPVRPVTPPLSSRRKPDCVRTEVLRLFHAMPSNGCRSLASIFKRLHATIEGMTVGKIWVSNLLRDHQRAMAAHFRAIKHRVPAPLPCNAVWGMGLTFKQDEAGDLHPILGIIDHGSPK